MLIALQPVPIKVTPANSRQVRYGPEPLKYLPGSNKSALMLNLRLYHQATWPGR